METDERDWDYSRPVADVRSPRLTEVPHGARPQRDQGTHIAVRVAPGYADPADGLGAEEDLRHNRAQNDARRAGVPRSEAPKIPARPAPCRRVATHTWIPAGRA